MGLHDCHIHIALDGIDWRAALDRHRAAPDEAAIRTELARYAEVGVTYLRDGGDRFGACEMARRIAGEYDIEYASPAFPIHQKGNYGSFIGRSFETAGEYRALVDEVVERGGDFVKVMVSGIMDFNEYGALTGHALPREMMEGMVAYAHEKGLAVMAHVNGAQAVLDAVEAGVDSVEHGYYTDERAREALAASNAIWVPTFAPICNLIGTGSFPDEVLERIAAGQRAAVAEVAANGGLIASGSDAGAGEVRHAEAAIRERELLREALGPDCDTILTRGFETLRSRFTRR